MWIKLVSMLLTLQCAGATTIAAAEMIPSSAGGFTLNTQIEEYAVSSHENYVKEIILTDLEGFRKGFITYGTCERPGEILRIKLKYNDRSYGFFEQLLKKYKKAFGNKPKFAGDQFGNVKGWKWSFTDEQGQIVTLSLQHNLKDSDESIGNMLKLSLPGLLDEERICFNKKHPASPDPDGSKSPASNWEILIPR